MNDAQNRENFNKCLAYIRGRLPALNGRALCIGYGKEDYNHPWNKDEFQNREYSLQINNDWFSHKDIVVLGYGCFTMYIYGHPKEDIAEWEKGFRGTGMTCPRNRFTWEDLDIVPFLLDWKHIKQELEAAIAKYDGLDSFEV